MRRAALIVLYPLVALLMTVPLMFAAYLSVMCMNPTGAPCRTPDLGDWFAGELAGIWMPPFGLALVLCFVIARLHKAG
ncbi:hypothetical protein [uncultured Sulfitobacter sp.]|uniref:hypothetical protein n=1 Tax=uncultured Sulfitobacter sp. TaxID=191468 RepID=UPI0026164D2F|nr:hypothetical protein [uncultured Sulfitobacter sp.]